MSKKTTQTKRLDGSKDTNLSYMIRDGQRISWADAFPRKEQS